MALGLVDAIESNTIDTETAQKLLFRPGIFEKYKDDPDLYRLLNLGEELDTIVDAAKAIPEVLGARLSGGGFGGSCCLLVRPEAADKIAAQITQAYKTAYGDEPTCAVIKPSAGAHLV